MKALVKKKPEVGIWMEEVEKPSYGARDILIKITKTAICGTDIHIYNWDQWSQETIKTPMVIGHEFVGVVEAVGEDVFQFKPGDRVSGEGHITCGACRNCRAGLRHLCRNTIGVGVNRQGQGKHHGNQPTKQVLPFCFVDGRDERHGGVAWRADMSAAGIG